MVGTRKRIAAAKRKDTMVTNKLRKGCKDVAKRLTQERRKSVRLRKRLASTIIAIGTNNDSVKHYKRLSDLCKGERKKGQRLYVKRKPSAVRAKKRVEAWEAANQDWD
jgi:hypothetical protein